VLKEALREAHAVAEAVARALAAPVPVPAPEAQLLSERAAVAEEGGEAVAPGRLPEGERQAVLRLLSEESASVTPELARECLTALKRQSTQRQISVTKAQMGAPGLPEYEVTRLAKVLLDLRLQLNET
jgi:hypothetical protein